MAGNKTPLFSRKQSGGVFTVVDETAGTGHLFWVNSASTTGADSVGYGQNPDMPFLTLNYAITQCTANFNDRIFIMAGHTENVASAGAIAANIAGISIIGLGAGASRPTFTFITSNSASILVTGASTTIKNILCIGNKNGLTGPIDIEAADCNIDIEWQDTSNTVEAVTAVLTTAAADRLKLNLKYIGFTNGSGIVRAINLVGVDTGDITIDFYGIVTTAVVGFTGTASKNLKIKGNFYVSGTTDLSKNVVDTIGSSTWTVSGLDGAAGASFEGGSGNAIAAGDLSSISSQVNKIDAATLAVSPTAGSLARFVASGGTALGTPLAASKSLVDVLGSDGTTVTDSATSVLGAIGANNADNAFDSSNVVANADGSLLERMEYTQIRTFKISTVALAAANFTGALVTRYTIANGPILVRHLGLLITTVLPAGANTLKIQFTPTGGSVTDLCGATDTASAAVQTVFVVDGVKATGLVKSTDPGILAAGQVEHMPIILGSGIIQTVFSAGPPATGAGILFMEWEPMNASATVV